MAGRMKELFQSLVKDKFVHEKDCNIEFKVCCDLSSFKSDNVDIINAMSNDMYRMNLFLHYTRMLIHTNVYFQQYLINRDYNKSGVLSYLSSFLDTMVALCKISGYDPTNFDFNMVMSWDMEYVKSILKVNNVDIIGVTGFLFHTVVALEDYINWRFIDKSINDWQGVREEVGSLFVLLAIMCKLMGVSYDDLCSFYISFRCGSNIQ